MLKKESDDINDLLQVEKELGRVREQIEQMQGELKFGTHRCNSRR